MPGDEVKNEGIIPPEWMDGEYLTKALREGLEAPELNIINFHIKPATAAGDNYASQMFRATTQIQKTLNAPTETLSIILKTTHQTKDEVAEKMNMVWITEGIIMRNIIPKMHDVLQRVYTDEEVFGAKCIWEGVEPASVLIIEDLKPFGYENANRMEGLDRAMTDVVLERLAKFHASSLYLLQTDPDIFQGTIDSPWEVSFRDLMQVMLEEHVRGFLEEVSTWEEISTEQLKRLKTLEDNLMTRFYDSVEHKNDFLKVLLHGDCWINNFMFSRKTKKELSFRFVDFQLGHVNSPALDLVYFLFTSPSGDIRISGLNESLKTYYNIFTETANHLGVEFETPITFEDLLQEFKNRLFFSIFALCLTYPLTVLDAESAPDFNAFFEENSSKRFLFKSKKFREVFNICLPYLLENSVC